MTKDYYLSGERVVMRANASGVWLHYDLHGAHLSPLLRASLGSIVLVTNQGDAAQALHPIKKGVTPVGCNALLRSVAFC